MKVLTLNQVIKSDTTAIDFELTKHLNEGAQILNITVVVSGNIENGQTVRRIVTLLVAGV